MVTTEALKKMNCDNQDYIDVRRASLKLIPNVKIEHFNLKKRDVFKKQVQIAYFKKEESIEKLFLASIILKN